jgi:hypothetical protein
MTERYRIVLVSGAAYVAGPDGQPPRHFPTIGAAARFKCLMERVEADIVRGAALQTAARRPWTVREALEAGGAP